MANVYVFKRSPKYAWRRKLDQTPSGWRGRRTLAHVGYEVIAYGPFESEEAADAWAKQKGLAPYTLKGAMADRIIHP